MFLVQIQKQIIIPFLIENILTIHTAIVDMIVSIIEKWGRAGHFIFQTLRVSQTLRVYILSFIQKLLQLIHCLQHLLRPIDLRPCFFKIIR